MSDEDQKENAFERFEDAAKRDLRTVAEKIGLGGVGGKNPTYGEEDRKGFVGVSPEYANAANATDLPIKDESDSDDDEPKHAAPEDETSANPDGSPQGDVVNQTPVTQTVPAVTPPAPLVVPPATPAAPAAPAAPATPAS